MRACRSFSCEAYLDGAVEGDHVTLMLNRASAEQDLARCVSTLRCMTDADAARVDSCRAEPPRAQGIPASTDP